MDAVGLASNWLASTPSICCYLNPHVYPVGLEQALYEFRIQLMLAKRPLRPA
jgi:nicotinate phosphoribosyltransferase